MDVQAIFSDWELKFPHLNSSLIELKSKEENDSCHMQISSAKMAA